MPNDVHVVIPGSREDREYHKDRRDTNHQVALMAAILLAGRHVYQNASFPEVLERDISQAVITAEKIFVEVWDRNSSSQIDEGVVDAAEKEHFDR